MNFEYTNEENYSNLLRKIYKEGEYRKDRTGVGTISLFGEHLKFDLTQGFPAVTTKKLAFKAVTSELLWFLEGSTSERRLAEIHYGKPREELGGKTTIWTANAKDYAAKQAYQPTEVDFLGPVYGYQWRHWPAPKVPHDQISNLVDDLKNNPQGRRHILSAWNVDHISSMALPPCHVMSQYYVHNDNRLDCHMYQRSADMFLGVPFNIASYALLTHMLAQVCGLTVGKLVISFGDAHIYSNHTEQVEEQLSRKPFDPPILWLNPDKKNIDDFSMEDIKLLNYQSHSTIKADMAV